jgi:hypothetical protein
MEILARGPKEFSEALDLSLRKDSLKLHVGVAFR